MRNFTNLIRHSPREMERPPACSHLALVPRWSNADDVGRGDRITSWLCSSCGETLTADATVEAKQ